MNALAPIQTRKPGLHIAPRFKSVARMVGFVLAADDAASWRKLTDVLVCRLAPHERGALALMALMALPADDFEMVIDRATPLDDGRATA